MTYKSIRRSVEVPVLGIIREIAAREGLPLARPPGSCAACPRRGVGQHGGQEGLPVGRHLARREGVEGWVYAWVKA